MSKFSRGQIEERIKSIVAEIAGYEEASLTSETCIIPDEHFDKVLGVGSLELAELLITIDEEFHVNIPDEEIIKLKTIGHLVDYILKRI